jgi:hypothetical protein
MILSWIDRMILTLTKADRGKQPKGHKHEMYLEKHHARSVNKEGRTDKEEGLKISTSQLNFQMAGNM